MSHGALSLLRAIPGERLSASAFSIHCGSLSTLYDA